MRLSRLPGFVAGFAVLIVLQAGGAAMLNAQSAPSQEDVEQMHQELRELKARAEKAVADRDRSALLAEFTENLVFTAINNEKVAGMEEAIAYFDKMLVGDDSFIEEMNVTFEPDDLSTLYLDEGAAVSTGASDARFKVRNGVEISLPLRWTVMLVRQHDRWKVAGVHFSADIFNNPLARSMSWYAAAVAFAIALAALALGYATGRRRGSRS